MNAGLIYLVAAIGLVAVGTLLMVLWSHRRETRRRWARYDRPAGEGEPNSVVCPSCRRRWYSARVIRERSCPGCGKSF